MRPSSTWMLAWALLFVLAPAGAFGDEEPAADAPPPHSEPVAEPEHVVVTAPRPIAAASETTVPGTDLAMRPVATPSDLLRVVPGLVTGQHAGGGKADQIFLRGFDADHGTDVAIAVDGVPVNLVSHAHGQGYADLHWLIPEVVAGVEARRGPYFADQGDFGTAGTVRFATRDRFDAPLLRVEGGSFATRRLLAAASPVAGPFTSLLAAEVHATDGPFEHPQDLETGRTDIAGIFIPDLIKVDLSTPGVRLAGGGPDHPTNPDDPGYSRLGVFGGDVLQSNVQDPFRNGGFVPGGWPNSRRFGDDVVDIAVTALLSDLRTLPLFIQGPVGDGVDGNDIAYNKVFPYEPTPQNGRSHAHHGSMN